MKNKIVLIFVVMALFFSCSTSSNTIPVMVSMPDSSSQPLAGYDRILSDTFSMEPPIKNLDATESINKYLTDDFAKALEREVEPVEIRGNYFKDPREYTANLKQFSDSVIITGKLAVDIKKRSVIKDFRDAKGKNTRRFVSIQHWQMKATIAMVESNTGKTVFKREFTEKKSNADPKDTLFTFEGMFFRVMDQVIKNFQKGKRIQKRFLLKR